MRGGARGSAGLHAQSPVEASESGSERENAPVLLSVAWLAAALQRKQRAVQLKTPVQVTFMLSGFTGFFVLSFGGTGVFLIKVTGKWCVLLLKRFSKVFPILSSHLSPVSLSHLCVPVHGGWSSWFGWSHCSATCIAKSDGDVIVPSRVRHRSCSNPTPSDSTSPPGNSCPGDALQVQHCSELPNCAGERGTNS